MRCVWEFGDNNEQFCMEVSHNCAPLSIQVDSDALFRRRHLFLDLHPWVCIDLACSPDHATFAKRDDWIHHLAWDHNFAPEWKSLDCLLCGETIAQGKTSILKHLGNHLEEVSLGSLPALPEPEAVCEDGSERTASPSSFFPVAESISDAIHQASNGEGGNLSGPTTEDIDTKINKPMRAPVLKAKYERPRHPKVKCDQCNETPEGFRGEHELRRHVEYRHRITVKKWICRDPKDVGIEHTETPIKPLSDCKQCIQKKQYGAYYNAAAHLRRTHFNRKSVKGEKAKKMSKGSYDKMRGGKGGGDWPSMVELKLWMVEVEVPRVDMDDGGGLFPVDEEGASPELEPAVAGAFATPFAGEVSRMEDS